MLVLPACEHGDDAAGRSDVSSQATAPTAQDAERELSPIDTVRLVHQHRINGELARIEPYLSSDQRAEVIALLQAVDTLRIANAKLQDVVIERVGPGTAKAFDRAGLADKVGVFSLRVDVLAERVEADRAMVTIQIAGRLPLDKVTLVRGEDRWLIRTDTPIAGVAKELRNLADALDQAARAMIRKETSVEDVLQELNLRQKAIARRLAQAAGGEE